ncbi:MAG: TetR/AcrR family transcriptional regulator [Desulfobacterales bacterium]|jgi:AcrR family transcriptional regulator|nr:TetR/AcrR family transcriptional regulator [Desulfobacterales bacterium]
MKEEKRKLIRNAAAKVFAERGFKSATTRDIARSARISPAAVYYYFDSKEDLLYQILEETISTGLSLIQEIEASPKSLKEKLSDILKIHTQAAVDFSKMKLLVHNQDALNPEHQEEIKEKQRIYADSLMKILEELKADGKMIDLDTKACAFAFFGMVSWAYRWYDPKGKISPARLSEIFNRIFTKGIYLD